MSNIVISISCTRMHEIKLNSPQTLQSQILLSTDNMFRLWISFKISETILFFLSLSYICFFNFLSECNIYLFNEQCQMFMILCRKYMFWTLFKYLQHTVLSNHSLTLRWYLSMCLISVDRFTEISEHHWHLNKSKAFTFTCIEPAHQSLL